MFRHKYHHSVSGWLENSTALINRERWPWLVLWVHFPVLFKLQKSGLSAGASWNSRTLLLLIKCLISHFLVHCSRQYQVFWSVSSGKGPRLLQLQVPCVGARLLKAPCISWSRDCSWQIYGMWKFSLIGIKEKVFRQRISSEMCVYREMSPAESSGPPTTT